EARPCDLAAYVEYPERQINRRRRDYCRYRIQVCWPKTLLFKKPPRIPVSSLGIKSERNHPTRLDQFALLLVHYEGRTTKRTLGPDLRRPELYGGSAPLAAECALHRQFPAVPALGIDRRDPILLTHGSVPYGVLICARLVAAKLAEQAGFARLRHHLSAA